MDVVTLGLAKAAIKRQAVRRVPVLARALPPIVGGLSDGTKQSRAFRTRHKVMRDAHSLRVAFCNYYNDPGSGFGSIEKDGPNSITVYAALENSQGLGGGGRFPVTPPGGITLLPGETRWLEVPYECNVGEDLFFITQVSVATLGQKWPLGGPRANQSNEGFIDTSAAPTTDVTMTGSATFGVEAAYGPAAVIGTVQGEVSSVLVVGDSIAWGVGGTQGETGFINQLLIDNNVCHQIVAMSSSAARNFARPVERYRRMALTQNVHFSHVIYEYGTNDLGFTSGMRANAVTNWRALARHGAKVWALTCLPHTNDAGGLTPGSNESWRVLYNDWIRGGAPVDSTTFAVVAVGTSGALLTGQAGHPLAGYRDPADIAETARNSGAWKNGYTSDGVHPNTTGHTALRAAIDLAVMGIA